MKVVRCMALWALSISFFAMGMTQETGKNKYSGVFKSIAVSGLAGCFDVVFGRPCDYAKTMAVQKLSFTQNPQNSAKGAQGRKFSLYEIVSGVKRSYRGSLMNVMGLVPATGAQNLFASLFDPHMNEVTAFSLAGGLSTLVACPADCIVLKMQLVPKNETACMAKVIKSLYATGGIKVFYRGAPAIGLREWGFTLAYMKFLNDMADSAKKYVKAPWSEAAAICLGGPFFSLLTHPMETIRMRQQQGEKKSMLQVVREMRASELGLRQNLFAGFLWRASRCTMAMWGLIKAKQIVTNVLD